MSMGRDSEEQRQRHDTTIHGLALDVYARATIGMSSIFLGPALLSLANAAAGCSNSDDRDATNSDTDGTTTECTATVYGFRPSSLLTNIAAVSGVLGCIALPYFGSIIDRTPYRRHVGYGTAIGLTLLKAVETLLITPTGWILVAFLQVLASVLFYVHLTAAYAYLSELSAQPAQQSYYNKALFMVMYGSTLIFMVQVMTVSSVWSSSLGTSHVDSSDVTTARISQIITTLTCAPCFYYSWTYCFGNRPPAAARLVSTTDSDNDHDNATLWTAGYRTLARTVRQLMSSSVPNVPVTEQALETQDHPVSASLRQQRPQSQLRSTRLLLHQPQQYRALRYVLCAVALGEAAANALVAVSTTYMKNVLHMTANESTCARCVRVCFG
jgi:Major Facilitator Superfamily